MAYPPDLIAQNNASRERLRRLTALDDSALEHSLGGGWIVATAIGHVAFYDRRAVYILERWEQQGAPDPSPDDSEVINLALEAFLARITPRELLALALASADALDRKLETLSDPFVDYLLRETPFSPSRAEHRNEHLDQIAEVVSF